jgi:hypothetical protein
MRRSPKLQETFTDYIHSNGKLAAYSLPHRRTLSHPYVFPNFSLWNGGKQFYFAKFRYIRTSNRNRHPTVMKSGEVHSENGCSLGCIALMMAAVQTSETSLNLYQSTRRRNTEDSHLGTQRRGNVRSYLGVLRCGVHVFSVCLPFSAATVGGLGTTRISRVQFIV